MNDVSVIVQSAFVILHCPFGKLTCDVKIEKQRVRKKQHEFNRRYKPLNYF